jgi:D-alanine-D-alanine ligase
MNVALVYNVRTDDNVETLGAGQPEDFLAEWDSQDTIDAVCAALSTRHDVTPVVADENCFEALRTLKPDLVFNIAEGLYGRGREGQIPSICDMLQIPYTGSDALTLNLCLHKSRAKEVLAHHGVPTPAFFTVDPGAPTPTAGSYPMIVKPLYEGSSKGIINDCLVHNQDALASQVTRVHAEYRQPALVEQYLAGREFTVALLGNDETLRALPPVEICFDSLPDNVNPIYSYEAKWIWDTPDQPLEIFRCPPDMDEAGIAEVQQVALDAFRVLGCRDWTRVDVRCDEAGTPHIIELNPLPGILPNPEENSCFPKAARTVGLDYPDLLCTVVDEAARRIGLTAGSTS